MKIDPEVEAPLRSALWHTVNEDPQGALDVLATLNNEHLTEALYYSWFGIGYVVADTYGLDHGDWHESRPAIESGAKELAIEVVNGVSSWFDLGSAEEVAILVGACATGEMGEAIPAGIDIQLLPMMSIIVASYLLDRYRPQGQEWFEYLDQIWNFAEQQSAT